MEQMQATMSVLGLYRWDNDIFANFHIPVGLEKDTLINNILMECAELEVLYTDADFLKWAIGEWSAKMLEPWNKLYSTTKLEYNPIENYDRQEEWNDTSKSLPGTISESINSSVPFPNDTFVDREKSKTSLSGKNESTATRTGRTHGNIGVTTSQQMLKEEREVATFNIYDIIANDFKQRFCIIVY